MKIKAAIIGMGIGYKHFQAIEKYNNSEVRIICEKNKKKLNYFKKKYPNKIVTNNEDEIFRNKEINLVSIASYDNYHYSQIIKSLESNKHIIVEKPICLTSEELKKIFLKLRRKKHLKFVSNLVLRTEKIFNKFKSKIKNDKIFYIEGDYIWGRKHKLFGWRSKIKNYSLILGAAIHIIDLILSLTNQKPVSVYTVGSDRLTKNTSFKKKSFVLIVLEFSNGLVVKISANGVADYPHFHELKIFCEKQTLLHSCLGTAESKKGNLKLIKFKYPDKENRKKLIRDFIKLIIKKKQKQLISLDEQFASMSICLAAERSLKLGKKVKIKYL